MVKGALAARPRLSDAAIAEHVGVSDRMVARYRAGMTPKDSEPGSRTGRDGRTINTANIGKAARQRSGRAHGSDDADAEKPFDLPPPAGPTNGTEGEAHQTGASACQVTDQLGHAVEGKVAEAFRRRHEIQALMLAVLKVQTVVRRAKEVGDPLFADIRGSQFLADCESLSRQLKAALPYAVCPHCRALGCEICHGRGWVSESAWNAARKELKARSPGGTRSPQGRASSMRGARLASVRPCDPQTPARP